MLYNNHIGLVKTIISRFSNNQEDYENYMGIAHIAYCKARKGFNPKKGKFSTFLYGCITNAIIDEKRKQTHQDKYIYTFQGIEYMNDESANPERRCILNDSIKNMSEESRYIINMILSSPEEFFDQAKNITPKHLKGALKRTLRKKGWYWKTINASILEIKHLVNNF